MSANLDTMSPRTGRPPIDNPRTETIKFRATREERAAIAAAAERAGQTLADWMRGKLIAAAKRQR